MAKPDHGSLAEGAAAIKGRNTHVAARRVGSRVQLTSAGHGNSSDRVGWVLVWRKLHLLRDSPAAGVVHFMSGLSHCTDDASLPANDDRTRRTGATLPQPALSDVLWAPWGYALQPRRAAAVFVRARRQQVLAAVAIALFVLVVAILGVMYWFSVPHGAEQRLWSTYAVQPTEPAGLHTALHSFGLVWSRWHERGWWGPAEWAMSAAVIGPLLLIVAAAWIQLPWVHRAGPLWPSYARALRAQAAGCGALALSGVLLAFPVLPLLDGVTLRLLHVLLYVDNETAVTLGTGVMLWSAAWWMGRAARSAAGDDPLVLPPRCEACGYDLTHQSAAGRCSECGLPLARSLEPDAWRPGSAWQRRPGPWAWLTTMLNVLVRPRRFYARLKVRTPGSADRGFAILTVALLVAAVSAWHVVVCNVIDLCWSWTFRHPWRFYVSSEMLAEATGRATVLVWVCWVAYRVACALATTWWSLRRTLADCRWAAVALSYEAAYLSLVVCFWSVTSASLLLCSMWIAWRRGPAWFFPVGVMTQVVLLFGGPAALALAWLWRLRIIARAIRWSNF